MARILFKHKEKYETYHNNDLIVDFENKDYFVLVDGEKKAINKQISDRLAVHVASMDGLSHIHSSKIKNSLFVNNDKLAFDENGITHDLPESKYIKTGSIGTSMMSTDLCDIINKLDAYNLDEILESLNVMDKSISELYMDMEIRDRSCKIVNDKFFEDGVNQFKSSLSSIDNTSLTVDEISNTDYPNRILVNDYAKLYKSKLYNLNEEIVSIKDTFDGFFSMNLKESPTKINIESHNFYYDYYKTLIINGRTDTLGLIKVGELYKLKYYNDNLNEVDIDSFESLPTNIECNVIEDRSYITIKIGTVLKTYILNSDSEKINTFEVELTTVSCTKMITFTLNNNLFILIDNADKSDVYMYPIYRIKNDCIEKFIIRANLNTNIDDLYLARITDDKYQVNLTSLDSHDAFVITNDIPSNIGVDSNYSSKKHITKSNINLDYNNLGLSKDYSEVSHIGGNEFITIYKGIKSNLNTLFYIKNINNEIVEVVSSTHPIVISFVDQLTLSVVYTVDSEIFALTGDSVGIRHEISLNRTTSNKILAGSKFFRNNLNDNNKFNLNDAKSNVIRLDVSSRENSNSLNMAMNLDKNINVVDCVLYKVIDGIETKINTDDKTKVENDTGFSTKEIIYKCNTEFTVGDYMIEFKTTGNGFIQNILGTFSEGVNK